MPIVCIGTAGMATNQRLNSHAGAYVFGGKDNGGPPGKHPHAHLPSTQIATAVFDSIGSLLGHCAEL